MKHPKLKFFCLLLTAFFPIAVSGATIHRPKLVVLVAIDAFRFDYLTRFEKYLTPRGLKLLLEQGANFTNAHIDHLRTSTGPAHATMLTGAYGRMSGIIENEWWDRNLREKVGCDEDRDSPVFGSKKNQRKEGKSPKRLCVTTVGDELKLFNNFRSKVIGVSYKARSAILPGGKLADAAYWYDNETGDFVTSRFYLNEMPSWVKDFNKNNTPDEYFGRKWEKVLPGDAYSLSREDDFPHELDYKGMGIVFPHVIDGNLKKPGVDFYKAFAQSPFSDEHLAVFARAVIENENLGEDEVTDILTISFSATDRVSHQFGPYSVEIQDQVVRIDRLLQDFFSFLDGKIGLDNILIALTSDHGSAPIPEYMARFNINAGRIEHKKRAKDVDSIIIPAVADSALDSHFGHADWVEAYTKPNLYLNYDAIHAHKLEQAKVENVAATALRSVEGISHVLTRTQLLNGNLPLDEISQRHLNNFFSKRSGDLLIHNAPYYVTGGSDETVDKGADHETAYDYDTHIPLIIFGKSVKPGKYRMPVKLNDLAPTLSSILGLTFPSGNEGRVLFEALN